MPLNAMRGPDNESEKQFFLRLYEKYKRLILAKALSFAGETGQAEDVAQETWIRLLKQLPKLREMPEGAQVNYIVFTVRSAAFDARKKSELERRTEADHGAFLGDTAVPGAEEEFLSHLSDFRLADIWDLLTPAEQLLLEGKYLHGLSDTVLAGLLGCRTASIRMLLTRARRRARDLLLERREKGQ